jgi:hypothetical protein
MIALEKHIVMFAVMICLPSPGHLPIPLKTQLNSVQLTSFNSDADAAALSCDVWIGDESKHPCIVASKFIIFPARSHGHDMLRVS